jgi:two-component system KDP operon response regulator KdpE
MNQPQILVVDDEQQIQRALNTILGQQGYRVSSAETAEKGLALAATLLPDIIILDLGLPDMPGVEVCANLRAWYHNPIIILSAHDAEKEKVNALDAGADDYLTKPFSAEELLARIRVALRHHSAAPAKGETIITSGSLTIDLARQMVTRDGIMIKLTVTEYKLLAFLAANTGRVLTHKAILQHVWGYSDGSQMEYLRVYIRQLRQKIELDPHNPQLIITESGIGYRFIV